MAMKSQTNGIGFEAAMGHSLHEFLPSLFFVQNYITPNPAAHTWSLAVEEHFYLLLPFVIAFLGTARVWKWLVPFCLSAIPACLGFRVVSVWLQQRGASIGSGTGLNMGASHFHFDALLLGVALAVLAVKFPQRFLALGRHRKSLIAAGVICWALALWPQMWIFFWGTFGFTMRILGSAAILVGVCCGTRESGSHRGLLAWIGVSSYGIYVWHVTVMGWVVDLVGRLLTASGLNPSLRWVLMATCVSMVCVWAGVAVTLFIERPSLWLRDRWFPSRGRAIALPKTPAVAPSTAAPKLKLTKIDPSLVGRREARATTP
jgi:peptidoglycan/LPS O-acetylase OafA/YrhL